jgi:hypothetical protein
MPVTATEAVFFQQIVDAVKEFAGDAGWPVSMAYAFTSPYQLEAQAMWILAEFSWCLNKPPQWMWAFLDARGRTAPDDLDKFMDIFKILDAKVKAQSEQERREAREIIAGMTMCDFKCKRYNPIATVKTPEKPFHYQHLAEWQCTDQTPVKTHGISFRPYCGGYITKKLCEKFLEIQGWKLDEEIQECEVKQLDSTRLLEETEEKWRKDLQVLTETIEDHLFMLNEMFSFYDKIKDHRSKMADGILYEEYEEHLERLFNCMKISWDRVYNNMKLLAMMMSNSGEIAELRTRIADGNVRISEAKLKKRDLFAKRPTFD